MQVSHSILILLHTLQPHCVLDAEPGAYYIFKITWGHLASGNGFIFSFLQDLVALPTQMTPFTGWLISSQFCQLFPGDCVFLLSRGAFDKACWWLCVWVCLPEVVSMLMRAKCLYMERTFRKLKQRTFWWQLFWSIKVNFTWRINVRKGFKEKTRGKGLEVTFVGSDNIHNCKWYRTIKLEL